MTSRIDKLLTIVFCSLWAIFIFIEYWYFHPEYAVSLEFFQYADLTGVLAILGLAIGFGIHKMRSLKKRVFFANGLGILVLSLIIIALIIRFHFPKIAGSMTISAGEILTYMSKLLAVAGAGYFVFMSAFATGDLFFKALFSFSFKRGESLLIKTAVGVTILSIILVLLGTINVLKWQVVLPIFLLVLGVDWKGAWQFLKQTLWQPIPSIQQLNFLGFGSFYLFLIFVNLIFLQNMRPYPFGFDSLAIYLNLPQLIGQVQGLVEGYSPYYWSLFISLGYILFGQIEVVIVLSIAGGIFSTFLIYEICRKWLDVNYSILAATLFYSLPMINFQSYRDIKTDLGLLFILLAAVLVLMKWLSLEDEKAYQASAQLNTQKKSQRKKDKGTEEEAVEAIESQGAGILRKLLSEKLQLVIIMGLLSGMAIGIKLTGLILIFSILGVFTYIKGGPIGFITAFALIFAVVLIGGLEVATGLRAYHFGAESLKLIFPAIGLLGLGYLIVKKGWAFLDLVKVATVYLVFTGLVYLPWPVKNYKETNTIGINTVISGKPGNLLININQVMRNAQAIEAEGQTPTTTEPANQ